MKKLNLFKLFHIYIVKLDEYIVSTSFEES